MARLRIYTDGGADPNPGAGGWGAVLVHPLSGTRQELSGGADDTTNNRMELTAAIEALEALESSSEVELFTDSTYLRQGITKWIRGWRAAGWKRRDGEAVKNVDLWQRLDSAAARHRITWRWVKGHAGVEGNERADELATAAIRARKRSTPSRSEESVTDGVAAIFLKVSRWSSGGIWMAIVRSPEGTEYRCRGSQAGISASRLELEAVCEVLERVEENQPWQIVVRSEYLRRGARQWLAGWKRRDWRTSGGEPVKNADLWQRLEVLLAGRQVSWPSADVGHQREFDELARSLKEWRADG